MPTRILLVCLAAALLLVGTIRQSRESGSRPRPEGGASAADNADLRGLYAKGAGLFQAGRYAEAADLYKKALDASRSRGQAAFELRFQVNLGSCHLALLRYRDAMQAYLQARELGEAAGDWKTAGAIAANLSSVYFQTGDLESADEAAAEGLRLLQKSGDPEYRAQLMLQQAKVRARLGEIKTAMPLFLEAIRQADREGNDDLKAQAWNLLGYELLRVRRLDAAEDALSEGFRLRRLNQNRDLGLSYRPLALLRLEQADYRSAARLADLAVAASIEKPARVPVWSAYSVRGMIRSAEGRLPEALADFRAALDSARRWRLEVMPADAVRAASDIVLHDLYSGFITAANRLAAETGDSNLIIESFEAAEEHRAASLRALLTQDAGWYERLPAAYGEKLAELRSIEKSLLAGESADARARAQRVRRELVEMEVRSGLELAGRDDPMNAPAGSIAERVRAALASDEALLTFHLSEPESYLWAATRSGISVHRLAGRARILAQASAFADAVAGGRPDAEELGRGLYEELFGAVSADVASRGRWLLGLEEGLFRVPFAGLVTGRGQGRPEYLAEAHSLRVVPSAHVLLRGDSTRGADRTAGFVGMGDAIYNFADPRWRARASRDAGSLDLPRLPGSAHEIRACARAWGSPEPVLLEGAASTREALAGALRNRPAVLHVAGHVLPSSGRSHGLMALGLRPDGRMDLLTPSDVAMLGPAPGLVVLSGCGSGRGEAAAGSGLMGLTRAWLAAGADSVAASLWPVADDNGNIFLPFYRGLREGLRPAEALQSAQRQMIASGGSLSTPNYWAAYFLVSKE